MLPAGEGADNEGTDMADKLTGTDDSESIAGLKGDDTIETWRQVNEQPGTVAAVTTSSGGPGRDTLKGGSGDMDTISTSIHRWASPLT